MERVYAKKVWICSQCFLTNKNLDFLWSVFFSFFSDAWRRRRRRRRRRGKMDENEMPVSADVSEEEIPENAKQSIIAALTDQEASEDEPEEYEIHPKHAI